MADKIIWIIKTKQINPNDFYVKVDTSAFYTAVWVALSGSKEQALVITQVAITELELGETEILDIYLHNPQLSRENNEIAVKILSAIESIGSQEDVQLAAWVYENGSVW